MEKSGRGTKIEKAIPDGTEEPETCGIVMPISAIDGCDPTHWANVLEILNEAVTLAGFKPRLVSSSDDIGVIQSRIVQNLYENPIVVCDVSGKNPNVMFELGMRLAFDKPVIIVKDDATSYSFDTAPIEHLEYRRDLRYQNVVEFKQSLADKVRATVEKSKTDPNYSPFLKDFGKFTVATLDTKEVSSGEYILKKLEELQGDMQRLTLRSIRPDDLKYFGQFADTHMANPHPFKIGVAVSEIMEQFPDLDLSNKSMRNEVVRQVRQALLEKGIATTDGRIAEAINAWLASRGLGLKPADIFQ